MLHPGLRVTDLERSLAFYTAPGTAEHGRAADGSRPRNPRVMAHRSRR